MARHPAITWRRAARTASGALLLTAGAILLVTVRVRFGAHAATCGSGWDVVSGRSGWQQWWAQDVADPVADGPRLRTDACVAAVNEHIVTATALAIAALAALTASAAGGPGRAIDDSRALLQRRTAAFATATTWLGAILTMAGLIGVALLLADADAPLFLYVRRPVAALVGLVTDGDMSLERAITRRRSRRQYRPEPLPMQTIAQLLWAGQGITSADGKRTAPSAGALYPLEQYVVTRSQLLHYLPHGHAIEARESGDLRPALQTAAFGQQYIAAAPAVFVIAAAAGRTARKYGPRAAAFVSMEAGHATQNILLMAAALELAAAPVGSIDNASCATVLGLPPDQRAHYLIPIGRPG